MSAKLENLKIAAKKTKLIKMKEKSSGKELSLYFIKFASVLQPNICQYVFIRSLKFKYGTE